jgi:5'-phosphate synthase pdxT subunit
MSVRRNAFGRQIDSFETDLKFKGITEPKIRAVFIRAPWVESVGSEVEVLSEITDSAGVIHPVAVRQANLLATSFHPELTGDNRVHRFFVENICRQLTSF